MAIVALLELRPRLRSQATAEGWEVASSAVEGLETGNCHPLTLSTVPGTGSSTASGVEALRLAAPLVFAVVGLVSGLSVRCSLVTGNGPALTPPCWVQPGLEPHFAAKTGRKIPCTVLATRCPTGALALKAKISLVIRVCFPQPCVWVKEDLLVSKHLVQKAGPMLTRSAIW